MEILQFLLSFLSKEQGENLSPLIELLKKNNFDVKKTLQSINLEAVMPLIRDFISKSIKNRPEKSGRSESVGLNPIAKIADKDIVYILNKYFYEG